MSKIPPSDRRMWEHERRRLVCSGRRPGQLESDDEDAEEGDESETEEEEDTDESDTWCAYCCEQPRLQSLCAFFFALMLFSALLLALFSAAGLVSPVKDWLPQPPPRRPNQPPRPAPANEPNTIGVFPLLPASDPGQLETLQQQLERQQKLLAAQRQAEAEAEGGSASSAQQQPLLRKPHERSRGDARAAPLQQFQTLRPLAIGTQGQMPPLGGEQQAGEGEKAKLAEAEGSAQDSAVMDSQQQEQQAEQQVLMQEQRAQAQAQADAEGAAGQETGSSAERAQQAQELVQGFRGAGSGEEGEDSPGGAAGPGAAGTATGSAGVTVVSSSLPMIDVFSRLDPTTARTVAKLSSATITCDKAVPLAAANAPGGGQHRAAHLPNCNPPPQDTPWLRPSAAATGAAAAAAAADTAGTVPGAPVTLPNPAADAAAGAGTGAGGAAGGGVGGSGQGRLAWGAGVGMGVQHMATGAVAVAGEVRQGVVQQAPGMVLQKRQQQQQQLLQQQGQQGQRVGPGAADSEMAAPFQACVDHTKVQRMAEQSGLPYLLMQQPTGQQQGDQQQQQQRGLVQQEQALIRAAGVAKALGAVLVLPPLLVNREAQGGAALGEGGEGGEAQKDGGEGGLAERAVGMERIFSSHFFITHMYCSSGVWVVPQLPGSVRDRLPAGVTGDDVDALLAVPGGVVELVPPGVVAASGSADDAAVAQWLDSLRQSSGKGEVHLLIYNSSNPLPLLSTSSPAAASTTSQQQQQQQQQQRVRKNAMAALRLAPPLASAATQLLHLLRKAYQAQFGDLSRFHFAALHLDLDAGALAGGGAETGAVEGAGGDAAGGAGGEAGAEAGGGEGSAGAETNSTAAAAAAASSFSNSLTAATLQSAREALLALLDPSRTLLYVIIPRVTHRTAILKELADSFHVVTRDDLIGDVSSRFPEVQVQQGVEQGVAKEAAVFLGSSRSEFSRFVFQLRCFTRPLLGRSQRASVFYDVGYTVAPCRVEP